MVNALDAPPDPHTLLRLLPHGVLVVAPDWRVLYSNPEADRLIGTGGVALWERCPALEHTAFASGLRYAMADRTELLTESALPAVGWCQLRARPTPDGGLLILLRQVHAHTIETGQAKHALLSAEIGDALTREESLHAALARCASAMSRRLDCALVRIWVTDASGTALELGASVGIELDRVSERLHFGETKVGQIAEDGEPYLTNETATDPQVGRSEWIVRERIVAFAGYPLRVEDRVVGVFALYARHAIDHDMLNALSSTAAALSLGIDRKRSEVARRRAEARLRTQAGHLEVLHSLGQQLTAVLDVDVLAQKVIDAATGLIGAQVGVFFYNLPDRFMLYAVSGVPRSTFDRMPVPRSTALLAPTLIEQRIVRIDDITQSGLHGQTAPHFGLPPGHPPVTSYLGVPVVGRNGRRIGALLFGHTRPAMFADESERLIAGVAASAAIAMDNARLFREAHELIAALEKSNRELDQFAYVASHDLKAPLRGIANLATWIEEDLGEQMTDPAREHMKLLRARVVRLENLIAGILAYSRAGRDTGESTNVDVAAIVRDTWELLAPPPTARLAIDGELPVLTTARVQLQQVLMNLIGNAIKYNPGRDITIEVGARPQSREARRSYEFFVRDNGVGIAPEFHEKIWGLFQTLERRDKIESTGIGLSIVRKIVESQGGTTRVESRPGGGATFFFTWPADGAGESQHG